MEWSGMAEGRVGARRQEDSISVAGARPGLPMPKHWAFRARFPLPFHLLLFAFATRCNPPLSPRLRNEDEYLKFGMKQQDKTTSSFRSRCMELGDDEQQDDEELNDHLAAQPWCNGNIIAMGTSYSADTADLATTCDFPCLMAVVPCAADFDRCKNFWSGGIHNDLSLRSSAKVV